MSSAPVIDPSLRIASVSLSASDVARSADFYERVLGLSPIAVEHDRATLGPDTERPALSLEAIAEPTLVSPHSTGLFHVAWLHPSRAALADTVRRVAASGWPIDGASDHGVSEALYLSDPDGLGIEIYADRPREQWQRPADGHGVRMVTLALDLDDLLAQSPGAPGEPIDRGTSIGHVHLKVADVQRASAFYRDALGLEEQARLPSAAFLSAGGYHHHVGLNSWQSAGASPPPDTAPRLREVEFALDGAGALDQLGERLRERDGVQAAHGDERDATRLAVEDPDGHRLSFVAA